jgi:membrane protein involved in colicin uptake
MPPVTNGQFSFNVDTFYVAASGGQIHRRAAPPEIKALYDTSVDSTPDHPGHWYEAQLIHYGLPPSKVKATAKMRLLKALQDGALSVPKESIQIEKNLKKEWKKQDSKERPLASGASKQSNTRTTKTKTVTIKTTTTSKTVESKTTATKAAPKSAAAKASAVKVAAPKAAIKKAAAAKATAAPKTATKAAAGKTPAAPKAAAKTATAKSAAPKMATAPKTSTPKATAAKAATPKTAAAKRKRALNDEQTSNQPQTAKRRVGGKGAQNNNSTVAQSHPETSGWAEQPEYEDAPPSYDYACGIVSISFIILEIN